MTWVVAWHDTRDGHDHMRTFSNRDTAEAEAERLKWSGHSTWVIVTTYDVPTPRDTGENGARARRQRRLARARRQDQ